mgnify:CR=1 FL=1
MERQWRDREELGDRDELLLEVLLELLLAVGGGAREVRQRRV